ncbi:hypothetical protein [Elizabethkingia meningoseptica]|uniref:hypothetical protein n=1 Tax=Elizabethkingia meningoseptica TaxID=238 RepID=UPI0023AEDCF1|nr:hypothetical protein [Elizabethkingia meningoseptica]MDE5490852.1 hypothetical protein [Elizabethkingia meningoseptica]
MNSLKLIPLLVFLIGCKEKKVPAASSGKNKTTATRTPKENQVTVKKDSAPVFNSKELKDIPAVPTIKVPVPPVGNTPPVISCFNPNLKLSDAVDLINSEITDTQWFIVENKEVNYQKNKFDKTDTILVRNALQVSGWKLIDSTYTTIGNQHEISLKLQKEHRICHIKKTLYLSGNTTNNTIQEWFEIIKDKQNQE